MPYEVVVLRRARKSASRIPTRDRERIFSTIRALAEEPRPRGARKMRGTGFELEWVGYRRTEGKTRMKKTFGFTAIYTPIEDGWYMASVLELPEAITQGADLEEAREMLADAVREVLELRREEAEREIEGREDVIREPLAL